MRKNYGTVEQLAQQRILKALPAELRDVYKPLILDAEEQPEWVYVKAADSISAFLKCQQEMNAGNHEFDAAYETIKKKLTDSKLPEVEHFLKEYVPSFLLTIDEVNRELE